MGFKFAAFFAGKKPKISPIKTELKSPVSTALP